MSKKNKNNPQAEQIAEQNAPKNTPKKKMTKKEKRAIQEQHTKDMNKKKTRFYGIGFAFSLVAVAISFLSGAEVGTTTWSYVQIACYALMGCAGVCLKYGCKYEVNAKRAKTMDMIGLAFIAICVGMIFAEATTLFVK